MLIENKTSHIITQGFHEFATDKEGVKKATGKVTTVTLFVGVSDIPDAVWESAKEHKSIQQRLDEEELVERDSKPIFKRPEKEALSLVKKMVDAKLLKDLRKEDTREAVRKAIDAQLDAITLGPPDKKAAEES